MSLCLTAAPALPAPAGAQEVLDLTDGAVPAAGHMAMLRDPDGALDIADVSGPRWRDAFTPLPGTVRAGYSGDVIWVRLRVRRVGGPVLWWMEVPPPYVDEVTLYQPDGAGGWTATPGGDSRPRTASTIPYRLPVFPVRLAGDGEVELYLRLRSTSTLSAEPVFLPPELLPHKAAGQALFAGGLLAIYLVITLNIIYYTRLRDTLYASYCAWMAANGIAFFALYGYAHEFLFPAWGGAASWLHQIAAVAAFPIGVLFVSRLLYLRHNRPWFAHAYTAAFWIGVACLGGTLLGFYNAIAVPLNGMAAAIGLLSVGLSIDLAVSGFRPAWLYALAFAAHPAALVFGTLAIVGVLPPGLLIDNAYAIASLVNALALAVGLLDRINMDERAKLEENQTALDTALRRGAELEGRIAVTEQELSRSEALFETLATAAPVPLVLAAPAGGAILFANDSAARLLRTPVEELMSGADLGRLLPPADLDRLTTALEAADVVPALEAAVLARGGDPLWAVVSAARVHFRGTPALLVAINDITARRRLEHELTGARDEARAMLDLERIRLREQRQLIATAAHEFKTPLAVIDRAAQLLQFDPVVAQAGPVAQRLELVRDSVRRLRGVVDGFLADATLEAGRLAVDLKAVPLAPLLERSLALLDARLPPRTARLDSPPTPPSCLVDGRLLTIVLDNILDNACKYSAPDTVIEVTVAVAADRVTLTVADRGIGIPEEELAMVGSRFFRATNATGVAGTGLGLSTARHLLALQNATLDLVPRAGGGTVARIVLARAAEA